jgi:hypothetical protein
MRRKSSPQDRCGAWPDFKPNTDDMREPPSIPLITALQDMGATVKAFDPVGMELARIEMPDIHYSEDPYECAAGADTLVIVTEWEQFRALDLDRLKREMACRSWWMRNVCDPVELTKRVSVSKYWAGRKTRSVARICCAPGVEAGFVPVCFDDLSTGHRGFVKWALRRGRRWRYPAFD